ncbi:lamin tail domain-containing protein [Pedobacter glucosidilyticus]|uniref:lamin tail domain-containing protein n=1 Tax=Pedobacter glucosidilyticus TaxID=1122941 RepID=UPI0006890C8F|nr:lamin tail domain-containing protein [Pedobacter glucosidilyticus]
MRKILLLFLIICYKNSFAQINDAFSDGNFTNSPTWIGQDVNLNFIVVNEQLRSNNTTTNTNFYIATENSKALGCTWEFNCNLQFATSGANYVDVYLISNTSDLKATNINGYFVRIGNTADEIALYKRSGTTATSTKIIDGGDGLVSSTTNNNFKIKVSRTANATFNLERDSTGTGNAYRSEGTVTDNTFTTTNWFGFLVQQSTATFFQKHFFDNIIVQDLVVDITPPVLNIVIPDSNKITLNFNEAITPAEASNRLNYLINPGNIIPATANVSGNTVVLNLANSLNTNTYNISINNIRDLSGNVASTINRNFNYKKPYRAIFNDIVINEIFADPTPPVGLPEVEFIELWNRTTEDIPLNGYKYSDATSTYTFTGDTIKANEYLIICARADTNALKPFGRVLGISPWPSLNNTSDRLSFFNDVGTLINTVSYSDTWYRNTTKRAGGWTLELIDPLSTCKTSQLYTSSINAIGGTPGMQNSIYLSNRTTDALVASAVELRDSVTLWVTFNRGLDSLQASFSSNYSINNGVGSPQSVSLLAPDFSQAELKYTTALARNLNYTLTLNNIADCGVSIINNQALAFTYPALLEPKDLVVNEILFNPKPGGVDFVEVYNRSDKILDLKDLYLSNLNTDRDSLINIRPVSASTILAEPGSYWVLSTNPDQIKTAYQTLNPTHFVQMASMPAYNDSEGVVVLLDKNNRRIDQFNYDADMHFELLRDVEGISLERVSANEETNKPGNFKSATATVGYATPAYQNSQTQNNNVTNEELTLSGKSFSPDNDGFEDILTINYKLPNSGFVAKISIFNDKGQLVKKLIENQNVSAEGSFTWDGLNENNNLLQTGVYIVYAEFFDLQANIKKFKKAVALASKLN